MVKLRTLLTVFTFILKAEADYRKGVTFPMRGVQPITMNCASWPIRADCLSEGGTLKKTVRLREEGHRGPIIMYSIWKIMCFLNIKACQHILLHQIHKIMIFKKESYDPFNSAVFHVWSLWKAFKLFQLYVTPNTNVFLAQQNWFKRFFKASKNVFLRTQYVDYVNYYFEWFYNL